MAHRRNNIKLCDEIKELKEKLEKLNIHYCLMEDKLNMVCGYIELNSL